MYLPAQGRDGLVIFDHAHIADYEPSMYLVSVHAFAHPISQFCANRGAWLGELIALLSGLNSPSG